MPLRIGDTFADYRILRLLGSGGMGEVYLVQHPRLPRHDALKVLRPDVSSDTSFRERFIREADLAAGIRHPHIVGIHDRGEHDGQLWIAMDYIDGTDAAQLMQQRYPAGMPAELAIPIITAVASALDYAHKTGLLHRDVKPANIIVADLDTDEPRVYLADFGIARNVNDVSGLTTTNMTVGTVAYSAPEQLMGEDVDGRADEYALAATTFHLLTGSQLFPHSNAAVVISRHLNSTPPALSESRPALAALDPVLTVTLAKDRDDRFARCSDFSRALAEQSSAGGSPSPVGETKPAPVPKTAPAATAEPPRDAPAGVATRSKPWIVAAATVVVLVVIGGLLLAWRPWQRHQQTATSAQTTPGPSTSMVGVPPPVSTTTSAMPPPPPTFSPKSIDRVLLTADQLSKVLGINVSNDPSLGETALALNSSSYGTLDHSAQVTPRSCVGVVFTGEHDVYADPAPAEIKTQTFGNLYRGSNQKGPHLLQQTAAVFSSAGEAQGFMNSSQAQWQNCARGEVDATFGEENGAAYSMGTVQRDGDLITVAMATNGGENGPDACQQALGMRENVIIETRTCQVPDVITTYQPGQEWPKDPRWAIPDAQRVAQAILDNVTP